MRRPEAGRGDAGVRSGAAARAGLLSGLTDWLPLRVQDAELFLIHGASTNSRNRATSSLTLIPATI